MTFTILTLLGVLGIVACLLLPAVRNARESARRSNCRGNLAQIELALRNYVEYYGSLPPAYTTDANGDRLHSWRTLILPFLEERSLYDSIDLAKPWDDPVNVEALNTSVWTYQCPSAPDADNRTHTRYLAVVAPGSCFRPELPRHWDDIADDKATTLVVIEVDADHAVPWMSPVDADEQLVLSLGPDSRLDHPGGMNAIFADRRVRFLQDDLPAAQRRAMISIAGNDDAVVDDLD